jgi:transcriptional regulator with XRE-family HTH domain
MKYKTLHKARRRVTNLESLRRRAGLSQGALSRLSGVSRATISQMERPAETRYVAGEFAITRLAASLEAHPAFIAKGQLGKFECECCKGKGYTVERL